MIKTIDVQVLGTGSACALKLIMSNVISYSTPVNELKSVINGTSLSRLFTFSLMFKMSRVAAQAYNSNVRSKIKNQA